MQQHEKIHRERILKEFYFYFKAYNWILGLKLRWYWVDFFFKKERSTVCYNLNPDKIYKYLERNTSKKILVRNTELD
jgi:hypothetical protein